MNLRVLHLLDTRCVGGGPCAIRLLAELRGRVPGIEDDVLLLGGEDEGLIAHRVGLRDFYRSAAPAGTSVLAFSAVRRFLGERGPYSLIHAWSPATLSLACLLAASTPRLLMLADGSVTSATGHWLRMLTAERHGEILAASNTIARALKSRGVAEKRLHVLRPGVHFGLIDRSSRIILRQAWGVAEQTKVIALLGEPARSCDAWRAGWVLSMLLTGGTDAALVVSPRAARAARAWERQSELVSPHRLLLDPSAEQPWAVLPGCDAALFLGDDRQGEGDTESPKTPSRSRSQRAMPGMLPLLWAMAGGVPIVAEASYSVSEVLEHQHSALLVRPGDTWGAARACRRLFDDPHATYRLSETARSEAFSFFSRLRFCDQVRKVYEQITEGYPVIVEDLPVTGGLRFAGRP